MALQPWETNKSQLRPESRGPAGGALTPSHSSLVAQDEFSPSPAQQEEGRCSPPPATVQPIRGHNVTPQPMKSHSILTPRVLPLDSVHSSPSNSPLPCVKRHFSVLQTCLWFCYSLYVLNCNSLISE